VSTAYYAVFHALNARAVQQAFPTTDKEFRQRVQRWLAHADAARVCGWITTIMGTGTYPTPGHIRNLVDPTGGAPQIDQKTLDIADGFLELYEKRQEADYDHESVFTRAGTRALITLAVDVVSLIESAASDESKVFFGLVAMQAQARGR